jgi:hypothetical protein
MPLPVHTLDMVDGSSFSQTDRVIVGMQTAVPNAAGTAGASVTTAVTFGYGLTANYTVLVSPNQDATWFVSSKTSTGFNVVLTPRLAANSLAAGTFDVIVFA